MESKLIGQIFFTTDLLVTFPQLYLEPVYPQNLRTYRNLVSYSRWNSPGNLIRTLPLLGPPPETTQKRNHLQPENCHPNLPKLPPKTPPPGVELLFFNRFPIRHDELNYISKGNNWLVLNPQPIAHLLVI